MTKHMDLKPENILVRDVRQYKTPRPSNASFKVYIVDFGISRSYDSLDATETEGPTQFTHRYAAPEVVDREKRGLAADTFSLSCVFVEIYSVLARVFEPWARKNRDKTFPDFAWVTRFTAYEEASYEDQTNNNFLSQLRKFLAANEFGDTLCQTNITLVQDFLSTIEVVQMISANPRG
ncbi:hypothetical protein B0J11DRAFT_513130 [Dendryphion nanum]|uniref:Protein kinase domain-containing protein n=1 Tax=Dendryphion nanum TaxID=256645 RepID=A0A9P9CX98_9PLEO|nr:hypothetical protein B0J11DRAFT_513130 [Dendryphion nanum]